MIFRRITLAAFALALSVLCGCGGPQTVDGTQEAIPQYTLPPIIKEAVPAPGGELVFPIPVVNLDAQGATLNPLKTKNVELYNMFSLIYEAPIRIGADGRAEPELAETWSVDESGLVWTFHLREGVLWQSDYGEMTSADVVYTAGLLRTYAVSDSNYAYHNSRIAGVSAVDAYTVSVTLTEPGNAAVYYMTFPVLCKAYLEAKNVDTAKPVGTGAYKVDAFDMTESVQLGANPDWWKQQPYIKTLTAVCYPDHDTELAAFKQSLFDFVTTSTLTVDTYQKYGQIVYVDYLTQYYDCLVPNMNGLFADANLRLAVAHALDKRDIVSKALLGHAVVADYPVAPDSYLTAGPTKIFEFNRQKAMDLLEQSGWKDRNSNGIVERSEDNQIAELGFELLVDKTENYRHDVAVNIAAQLRECGMDVRLVEAEPKEFKDSLDAGNFDIALCPFYMEINPDISVLVGSGGASNYGSFSDAELDSLLAGCRAALDEDAMKQAYTQMEDRFLTQMPQIGLYYRTNALLYQAKIFIASNLRDRNLFATLPQWYLFVERPEE